MQDLVKFSLPTATSDLVNKIYQNALLLKMLKVAVRDGFEKVKNGAKVGEKSLAGY